MTAYDEFAYPGQVFPQTHPNRLAVLAIMHGLSPPPPNKCRVLEVGCGDGINLLALALGSPESTFVGIDLAQRPIEYGREIAAEIGLTNIELIAADLMEYEPEGTFDYIIAHGFMSWVPPTVQRRLLELCRRTLAPHGVAFISYNTYPGFHLRRMIGEMMRFHAHGATDPRTRIDKARGILQFLLAGYTRNDEYAAYLRHEAQWVLNRESEAVLIHDDLAEINIPFYIRDFVALAGEYDLQFLAEADFFEMNPRAYPPQVAEALLGLKNIVLREQYIDFLKCRRFRQTLLVHREASIQRDLHAEIVRQFMITSPVEPASEPLDLSPGVIEAFDGPRSGAIKIDHPLTKAALLVLRSTWPSPVPFGELVSAARPLLDNKVEVSSDDEEVLTEVLLQMHSNGVAEFHLYRPHWATEVSEHPVASPLLRALLKRGRTYVVSLRPFNMRIDVPFYRHLLLLLDGTNDRAAIERQLAALVESRDVLLPEDATPEQLPQIIDASLQRAARDGTLIA